MSGGQGGLQTQGQTEKPCASERTLELNSEKSSLSDSRCDATASADIAAATRSRGALHPSRLGRSFPLNDKVSMERAASAAGGGKRDGGCHRRARSTRPAGAGPVRALAAARAPTPNRQAARARGRGVGRRCRRQPSRRTTHLRPHTTTTARRAGPGCWARIRIQHTVGLTKQEKTLLAFRLQPTFFTYSLPETQIDRSIFQQPLPS